MLKCIDCDLFAPIANTPETGQGICQFGSSWQPTSIYADCPFLEDYHHICGECDHYAYDTACMTAEKEDSADNCCGYVDKREADFSNLLFEWKARGIDYHSRTQELLDEIDNFVMPHPKEK